MSPFTPSCPRGVPLGLPRGGKGFYVSGVMMLLGPPGPIPRRACCGNTDDNKVHRLTTDWGMAGYTQGTFFNVTQTDDVDFNQWDEVEELNEKATPSEMLGFNLDTSNIETELANCRAVYEKYYSELFTGAQDPRELVKTIDAELETAGWETIREEAQKQIDAQK